MKPRPPYRFDLTVKKPGGWDLFTPFEAYEKDTIWTGLHVKGTLVGLKLRSSGEKSSSRILAEVYLADLPSRSEELLVRRVLAQKLGVNEDLSAFYSFASSDPILRYAAEHLRGMHDTLGGDIFDLSVLAICLQMATLNRSLQMMNCLVNRFGDVAEFDGRSIRVWPSAGVLSSASVEKLRRECRLGYRAKYIIRVARTLEGGRFPTLEELSLMPAEESKKKLMELPGIGDYSADIINPRNGFPIDAWSVDVFGKLFFGREPKDARASIEKVKEEGLRRWGRWSWLAFLYVVHDLPNLSRKLNLKLRLQ